MLDRRPRPRGRPSAPAPAPVGPSKEVDLSRAYRRAALAVAETILPGSEGIRFADETTVERVEEVVLAFDRRLAPAWRLAVLALDYAAIAIRGRPLHALSRGEQGIALKAFGRNPLLQSALTGVGAVLKLVHFDEPTVEAGSGVRLHQVYPTERPRWLSGVHWAAEWTGSDTLECDVVVVGSGAGGAVVAAELAQRGHAVVVLEEGEHHTRDAFDGSAVRAHQRFYRAAFSTGNVVMPIFAGRLVGGSTAINTGSCFRTPDWVLERWCETLGTEELSPGAMREHFERIEHRLGVEPAPLEKVGPIARLMAAGCDELGWRHGPVHRNAPGCTGEGFCDFGCGAGARQSTDVSYIPSALERGNMLLTGMKVRRVLVEGDRAVGVEGTAANGHAIRVRASRVVLAGGAIPTPLLLLRQGLCNGSGQLGCNLALQPSAGFTALFDEEIDGHRYIPQGYQCDEFVREGQLMMTAQVTFNYSPMVLPFVGQDLMDVVDQHRRLASFALLLADSAPRGRVLGEAGGYPAIRYDVSEQDTHRMQTLMVRAGRMCLAAGAKKLFPVTLKNQVMGDVGALRAFEAERLSPRDILWLSYHPLGTCRMGRDPKSSVVGLDHQTHDVRGLYVVDGSTVPGAIGVNPQMTIMAMATRAARIIAEGL
jgi:choline dehydrogenase-like flavoprotein